ncbi:MAG: NADH-dependent [FeFe] hydrogenase, group A6 [Bacillota bacterium]|jgi:iron-only hydrogenase group A|nr:NADH-dependent [FeFe] hydrogenase, group A6 [Bacillota bacterium]HPZ53535.1 NADH-dependent [FeFe] hydrogenase, group A6 [Bacillota bacterium]HQD17096.1 NADH-dependent [FeFe] hydrogenase, group A6 [Bacillota bacterium]
MAAVQLKPEQEVAMATLTIDGHSVTVPEGTTVLEAAKKVGITIPTLCHHPDLPPQGICRLCVVEVEGSFLLQTACTYPVKDGMKVRTNSPLVRESRRTTVELMLARGDHNCPTCPRNQNCELQTVAESLGIREIPFQVLRHPRPKDMSSASIVRDPEKCILCRRCVAVCQEVQGVGILFPVGRGFATEITTPLDRNLSEVACVNCGQCVLVCPVGAIYEKDDTNRVWEALADPSKVVIVQTAPAVRVSIGEELGLPPGSITTGKLVSALREMGFDKVFDTDFTADLTIIEEGHELLQRMKTGGTLPMLTSCSPGWIKFIEHYYPELLDHVSTCKSPQQMFGALAKTYYAQKAGIDPKDIYSVSVMPCTAKKFECTREEMCGESGPDVDVVLTTRELGRMIRQMGLDFANLPESDYDDPFGISTGAGVIFGATGGVMEAALRTVYEVVTGKTLPSIDFHPVRGLEAIKEADVDLDGVKVKVAVAHGLSNAKVLLEQIKRGESDYHFIEIMCCPGGCIGGGGQPIPTTMETRAKRIRATYEADRSLPLRKSHENPAIKKLYSEFLKEPLGEKSHELLHTTYRRRPLFQQRI